MIALRTMAQFVGGETRYTCVEYFPGMNSEFYFRYSVAHFPRFELTKCEFFKAEYFDLLSKCTGKMESWDIMQGLCLDC